MGFNSGFNVLTIHTETVQTLPIFIRSILILYFHQGYRLPGFLIWVSRPKLCIYFSSIPIRIA